MLPSVVLTQLNEGHCAAFFLLPVVIGKCSQPVLVIVFPQDKPSLTTLVPAAKIDWANLVISALRNPLTTYSFKRFGWRSRLVSTAATNGVLPAAPRPRLPPERTPPR